MKQIRFFWWIFLPVLVSCGKKEKKTHPEFKTLTEAVYASGNIYPKNEYQVFANADGLLSDIYVEAGDHVLEGQPLFKIDDAIQEVRKKTSNAIYQTAIENFSSDSPTLQEAKTQLENARIKMENDSINYIRYKDLWENNATSKIEFDRSSLAYTTSKNDYQARRSSLERLRRQLYVELQNAESQYKSSARDEQNYLIKAMLTGTVYEVYKERGEAVRRNDPIALLGDNQNTYIRLSVDELDIEKLKPGQEVLVKVDLYRDRIFKAKITRIYRKMNIQDQSFRVDAEFSGAKPTSYYGLTVEANIIIGKKDNVLTIPKSFLAGTDSVWIKTDDGDKKIKIHKGIEDFDYVEVMGGVDKNTEVLDK